MEEADRGRRWRAQAARTVENGPAWFAANGHVVRPQLARRRRTLRAPVLQSQRLPPHPLCLRRRLLQGPHRARRPRLPPPPYRACRPTTRVQASALRRRILQQAKSRVLHRRPLTGRESLSCPLSGLPPSLLRRVSTSSTHRLGFPTSSTLTRLDTASLPLMHVPLLLQTPRRSLYLRKMLRPRHS